MLTRPAVAVVQERVTGLDDEFGTGFAPAAIRTMDNAAVVVMDSIKARFVIVVEDVDAFGACRLCSPLHRYRKVPVPTARPTIDH